MLIIVHPDYSRASGGRPRPEKGESCPWRWRAAIINPRAVLGEGTGVQANLIHLESFYPTIGKPSGGTAPGRHVRLMFRSDTSTVTVQRVRST